MDTVRRELFHKFQAGRHYFSNCRGGGGLTIYPEQGLGTGLPEENPAIVVQKDLRAIEFTDIPDTAAGKIGRRIVLPSGHHGISSLNRHMKIPAVVMEFP